MKRFRLACGFACVLALPQMTLAAPGKVEIKPEAKTHLVRGGELYKQGSYSEAISEFLLGQSIDPSPLFLYALGQAERKKGDCARASEYYRSFLKTSPSNAQAKAAQTQIDHCDEIIAQQKSVPTAPSADAEKPTAPGEQPRQLERETTTATSTFGSESPQIDRQAWYKDIWGGVLLGSGLAAIGVGAWMFTAAGSDEEEAARSAPDYLSYGQRLSDAESKRNMSIILLSAGGALTAGAIIRYILADKHAQPVADTREVRFAPTVGGLRVWGKF